MDVLVSGAGGLIGNALTRALAGAGHRVVRLRRGGATGGDEVGWDPEQGTIDAAALEGLDAVVHLAGEGIAERRWSEEQKRRILDSRTRGTALLAGALASRERKPGVLVSASAVGFYGDRGEEELTEESASGEGFLAEVCRRWEAETAPVADAEIRTVLVRTGIVLARRGGTLRRLLLPFRLGLGGRIGSGRQHMSWITIDDEVGAILHAITNAGVRGPVNLTAPHPVTNAEFTRTLARVLRRPALVPTPLFALKAAYGPELVQELLLSGQRVLPRVLESTGYEFRHPSLEDALRAILGKAR